MERMEQLKAMLSLCLIFGMAFCLGSGVGHTVRVRDQAVMARPAQKDWGLSFQEDNKPPVADENMEQLAQYDAFYAENTTEKVLYLTFDCGYENGNTPASCTPDRPRPGCRTACGSSRNSAWRPRA